jgi:endonuclease/exonuclease/phosphatase (EEP) superfamily protein YafD
LVGKGVGRLRVLYPVSDQLNITIDLFNTHLQSDISETGQQRPRRVHQVDQFLPQVEDSDADLVFWGGDFNDIPESGIAFKVHSSKVECSGENLRCW